MSLHPVIAPPRVAGTPAAVPAVPAVPADSAAPAVPAATAVVTDRSRRRQVTLRGLEAVTTVHRAPQQDAGDLAERLAWRLAAGQPGGPGPRRLQRSGRSRTLSGRLRDVVPGSPGGVLDTVHLTLVPVTDDGWGAVLTVQRTVGTAARRAVSAGYALGVVLLVVAWARWALLLEPATGTALAGLVVAASVRLLVTADRAAGHRALRRAVEPSTRPADGPIRAAAPAGAPAHAVGAAQAMAESRRSMTTSLRAATS